MGQHNTHRDARRYRQFGLPPLRTWGSCLLGISLVLALARCSASGPEDPLHEYPADAALITSDIDLFWEVFGEAVEAPSSSERQRLFEEEYLTKGSNGLNVFARYSTTSAVLLTVAVEQYPNYYQAIEAHTRRVQSDATQRKVRSSFQRMDDLYPPSRFPDVYFLVGWMSAGGRIFEDGLLIGAEIFGRGNDVPVDELTDWHKDVTRSPDYIPMIVAHELVHFQQTYARDVQTLLEKSIAEGSADFIAELIAGEHISEHVHAYGDAREAEIWQEFERVMLGHYSADWLYEGNRDDDRPADLGYYVGYQIVEAYYNQATDKTAAIREILTIQDFEAFLEQSGYPQLMEDATARFAQAPQAGGEPATVAR